ncbi:MAG: hypothetical protein LC655_05735, partial [Bacteroidales bacterium]|nr:hypothetical protein [Bacteroidales bacterium]
MMRIFAAVVILLVSLTLLSQENENYLEIVEAERQLKTMFDELYQVEVTDTNMDLFHAIDSTFNEALQLPGSFHHRWESLDMIGKLISDDGLVKVFSWVYMASRDDYH